MPSILQALLLLVFPVLVIVAALRDVTSFTIPNWISGLLILAFIPAAFALGLDAGQMGMHAGVGLAALAAGVIMFALGWIGGGDAKLFAAAGLWLGWPAAVPFMIYTALAGGALAVALLSLRSGWLRAFALTAPAWIGRLATPGENVPYGVAIAFGAMAAFPGSSFIAAWGGL